MKQAIKQQRKTKKMMIVPQMKTMKMKNLQMHQVLILY